MATVEPVVEKTPPDPARMNLFVPNKDKVLEDGALSEIGLGAEVTIMVTGKITAIDTRDWGGGGVDFSVAPDRVSIDTKDKKITLDDAITAASVRA